MKKFYIVEEKCLDRVEYITYEIVYSTADEYGTVAETWCKDYAEIICEALNNKIK